MATNELRNGRTRKGYKAATDEITGSVSSEAIELSGAGHLIFHKVLTTRVATAMKATRFGASQQLTAADAFEGRRMKLFRQGWSLFEATNGIHKKIAIPG